jgi:hypothetical protein
MSDQFARAAGFELNEDILLFDFVGNHDEVQNYLRANVEPFSDVIISCADF